MNNFLFCGIDLFDIVHVKADFHFGSENIYHENSRKISPKYAFISIDGTYSEVE